MGGVGGGSGVIVGREIFVTVSCIVVEGYPCYCEEFATAFTLLATSSWRQCDGKRDRAKVPNHPN